MNTKIENTLGGEKGEHLITRRELACRLKRTVRTISNWQRRGIIPYVRWRHAVYFDWHAVRASLEHRGGEAQQACQSAVHPVAADVSPQVTNSDTPHLKGPVRLRLYEMREEKRVKCRGLTSAATKNYENQNHTKT